MWSDQNGRLPLFMTSCSQRFSFTFFYKLWSWGKGTWFALLIAAWVLMGVVSCVLQIRFGSRSEWEYARIFHTLFVPLMFIFCWTGSYALGIQHKYNRKKKKRIYLSRRSILGIMDFTWCGKRLSNKYLNYMPLTRCYGPWNRSSNLETMLTFFQKERNPKTRSQW